MISLIFARAANNVIGKDNKLPWHLPDDLKWFKQKTLDKPVIMGFNTFTSIIVQLGKALPKRANFVLTSKKMPQVLDALRMATKGKFSDAQLEQIIKSVVFCPHLGTAIQKAERNDSEVFIIGGVRVYSEAIKDAHRLYVTEIHQDFEGDTYFPDYNQNNWELNKNPEENQIREHEGIKYSFNIYDRVRLKNTLS